MCCSWYSSPPFEVHEMRSRPRGGSESATRRPEPRNRCSFMTGNILACPPPHRVRTPQSFFSERRRDVSHAGCAVYARKWHPFAVRRQKKSAARGCSIVTRYRILPLPLASSWARCPGTLAIQGKVVAGEGGP